MHLQQDCKLPLCSVGTCFSLATFSLLAFRHQCPWPHDKKPANQAPYISIFAFCLFSASVTGDPCLKHPFARGAANSHLQMLEELFLCNRGCQCCKDYFSFPAGLAFPTIKSFGQRAVPCRSSSEFSCGASSSNPVPSACKGGKPGSQH